MELTGVLLLDFLILILVLVAIIITIAAIVDTLRTWRK